MLKALKKVGSKMTTKNADSNGVGKWQLDHYNTDELIGKIYMFFEAQVLRPWILIEHVRRKETLFRTAVPCTSLQFDTVYRAICLCLRRVANCARATESSGAGLHI